MTAPFGWSTGSPGTNDKAGDANVTLTNVVKNR